MCGAVQQGIFRRDISLRSFGLLFYDSHPDIANNKKARWVQYLRNERNAVLLERPSYSALWRPHKVYMPPIPEALQSSYEDVEKELREMTTEMRKKGVKVLFVAGDGLALMRLNHLLANKPEAFIDQTPMIIPIQGSIACLCFNGMAHATAGAPLTNQCVSSRTPQVSIRMGFSMFFIVNGAFTDSLSCGVLDK